MRLTEIRQTIYYGQYAILRTLHTFRNQFEFPMKVTLKREGEDWRVTNDLQSDPVFQT